MQVLYLILSCVLGIIFNSSDSLFISISHEILKYFSALMPTCVSFKSQYYAHYAV